MRKFRFAALGSLAFVVGVAAVEAQEQSPAQSPPVTGGTSCDAQAALADLDRRTPVPLLPMMAHHQKQNMRDHLVAVQEIVAALAAEDFPAVERAAARIGYSEQMATMCTHMGAGAPGFTDQAMNFHRTADTISEAAREKDGKAVASALGATLQTCTGCHATYRQEVVDREGWSRSTSMPPPGGKGGPGMGWRHGTGTNADGPPWGCGGAGRPDCPAGAGRGTGPPR
jgi:hypothetical protein